MANFKMARIGEYIDDISCPSCGEMYLRLLGLHIFETDTPLLLKCEFCGEEIETNNDGVNL